MSSWAVLFSLNRLWQVQNMVIASHNDINKSKSNTCRWSRNFTSLKNISLIDNRFLPAIVFKWNIALIPDIILNLDKRNSSICFNASRLRTKCYIGDMPSDVKLNAVLIGVLMYFKILINASLNNFTIKLVWAYADCIVL